MNSNLPYPIKKEISLGNKKIVLLKRPSEIAYNRNVFCLDEFGNIVWQIEELPMYPGNKEYCSYVNIDIINDRLVLFNVCDLRLIVYRNTGVILENEETR